MLKISVPRKGRCKKLDPKFEGPYKITQVHSRLNYTICHTITNKTERVHVQRLIPYNVSSLRDEHVERKYNSDLESEYSINSSQIWIQSDSQFSDLQVDILNMPGSIITNSKLNDHDAQLYEVTNNNNSKWYHINDIPRQMIKAYNNQSRRQRLRARQLWMSILQVSEHQELFIFWRTGGM